jgi:transposase
LNAGLKHGAWTDKDYENLHDLDLPRSLKVCLEANLRLLKEQQGIKKELSAELRALYEKERYKVGVCAKKSCPGIGWFTAIRLTLEWSDMSRFRTGKHIASYTGLTSSEYSTGETVRRGPYHGTEF